MYLYYIFARPCLILKTLSLFIRFHTTSYKNEKKKNKHILQKLFLEFFFKRNILVVKVIYEFI